MALAGVASAGPAHPHIIYLLVDDWYVCARAALDLTLLDGEYSLIFVDSSNRGWAEAGFHRPPGYAEVKTPNMDALVKDGVQLDVSGMVILMIGSVCVLYGVASFLTFGVFSMCVMIV